MKKINYQRELLEDMRIQEVFSEDILFYIRVFLESSHVGYNNNKSTREQARLTKLILEEKLHNAR